MPRCNHTIAARHKKITGKAGSFPRSRSDVVSVYFFFLAFFAAAGASCFAGAAVALPLQLFRSWAT